MTLAGSPASNHPQQTAKRGASDDWVERHAKQIPGQEDLFTILDGEIA